MIGKRLKKIIGQLLVIFCILKKILLLMTPNEEKEGWHYLAVKKLSILLRGITSWLKYHEKGCKNKNFVEL